MPQERDSNYPYPTAEDVALAPGGREIKAARNIMARHVTGIPRRGYLLGESDGAPVVQGVNDLTTACYRLLDAVFAMSCTAEGEDAATALLAVLEDHGCLAATGA